MDIAHLDWPREESRRLELERQGVCRLLCVEDGVPPPVCDDHREDWFRASDPHSDIEARREALRRLAGKASDRPPAVNDTAASVSVDDNGVLRSHGSWVSLPPVEARLLTRLIADEGQVVSRDDLSAAGWPTGSPGRNALDVRILRLRRRIEPLGLMIRTIRSKGYLLEIVPPSND